jgi:hypothetical protein
MMLGSIIILLPGTKKLIPVLHIVFLGVSFKVGINIKWARILTLPVGSQLLVMPVFMGWFISFAYFITCIISAKVDVAGGYTFRRK